MPQRLVGAASTAAVIASALAGVTEGLADEALPAMRINCPELSDEDRAALEARARAELSVVPLGSGVVVIECSNRRVSLEGRDTLLERYVANGVSGVAFVDELLNGVQILLAEARRVDTKTDAGPPSLAQQGPRAVPPARPEGAGSASEPPLSARRFYRVSVGVGLDSELWSGAVVPAMGGHAGARLSVGAGWATEIDGGILWGLGTGQGIEVRALGATLRFDYAPIDILRLGLGVDVRLVMATGSGPSSPAELNGMTYGSVAAARFALRVGRFDFLVGPQAEVFAWPVVVQVNGREVTRVPTLVPGLSLEAAADLTR